MNKITVLPLDVQSGRVDFVTGQVIDDIIIDSKIKESLNGLFELEFTIAIDRTKSKEYYDIFQMGAIVKARDEIVKETPFETIGAYQYFRIVNIRKNRNDIEIYCLHGVQNDIMGWFLEDVRPTNETASDFLSTLLYKSKYKTYSLNIYMSADSSSLSNQRATSYFINKTVYEAIYDSENSFLKSFDCELVIDTTKLYAKKRRGMDTNLVVEFGKNLKGLEVEYNSENLTTVIYPVGFDGIKTEKPIESDLKDNYPIVYPRVIKYENVKVKGENSDEGFDTLEQAQAELERLARLEYTVNKIDTIKATYKIDFVELEKSEQYVDSYSEVAQLNIGDTITVVDRENNIKLETRVLSREFSPFASKKLKITLSNDVTTSTNRKSSSDILGEINNINNSYGNLSGYISEMIKKGIENSFAIAKQDEFLVTDSKNLDTAKNVVRLNRNGLGFSQNGYDGEYTYGFTIDGKMNASLITTGELSADLVRTGVIQSQNGDTIFNLENGEISSSLSDGSRVVISPRDGFYNVFGNSKREYHHLNYSSGFNLSTYGDGNDTIAIIQLPDEFKGKTFRPACFLQGWFSKSGGVQNITTGIVWDKVSYTDGTFGVLCKAVDSNGQFFNNVNIGYIVVC